MIVKPIVEMDISEVAIDGASRLNFDPGHIGAWNRLEHTLQGNDHPAIVKLRERKAEDLDNLEMQHGQIGLHPAPPQRREFGQAFRNFQSIGQPENGFSRALKGGFVEHGRSRSYSIRFITESLTDPSTNRSAARPMCRRLLHGC